MGKTLNQDYPVSFQPHNRMEVQNFSFASVFQLQMSANY